MERTLTIVSAFTFMFFITIQSCKKDNEQKNENETGTGTETKISSHGNNQSHNIGQNCMSCHNQGGTGEGLFNIAGSVYDSLKTNPYPNATVRLYTGPGGTGTLKYTIPVDALGNFYTTESIDFSQGLYPSVQGSLTTQYMSSTITIGQCNSCHGSSTNKIWVK